MCGPKLPDKLNPNKQARTADVSDTKQGSTWFHAQAFPSQPPHEVLTNPLSVRPKPSRSTVSRTANLRRKRLDSPKVLKYSKPFAKLSAMV